MNTSTLQRYVEQFSQKRILVVGDFFLDKYLLIDPTLDEPSLETGLTAYQIVGKRLSPGAAGTVTNNLRALGIDVVALGFVGEDGEGYELKKGLAATGVDIENLLQASDRMTPTYTKPMVCENGTEREINRQDIRNRSVTPVWLEDALIARLQILAGQVDAIIALDQVVERNTGVITDRVRDALAELGGNGSCAVIYADSRAYISLFRNCIVKCNHYEVVRSMGESGDDTETLKRCTRKLMELTKFPICVTRGELGQLVFEKDQVSVANAFLVEGPVDICGAGDATTSGTVAALACGATMTEAAVIGNAVASITIQQLGTTGTATPEQLLERLKQFKG